MQTTCTLHVCTLHVCTLHVCTLHVCTLHVHCMYVHYMYTACTQHVLYLLLLQLTDGSRGSFTSLDLVYTHNMYIHVHVHVFNEVKQTHKAKQHSTPKAVTFQKNVNVHVHVYRALLYYITILYCLLLVNTHRTTRCTCTPQYGTALI